MDWKKRWRQTLFVAVNWLLFVGTTHIQKRPKCSWFNTPISTYNLPPLRGSIQADGVGQFVRLLQSASKWLHKQRPTTHPINCLNLPICGFAKINSISQKWIRKLFGLKMIIYDFLSVFKVHKSENYLSKLNFRRCNWGTHRKSIIGQFWPQKWSKCLNHVWTG